MKHFHYILFASAICLVLSCNKQSASESTSDSLQTQVDTLSTEVEAPVEAIDSVPTAKFASITRWVISLEAMSSFEGVCTEEEARAIEAEGDDDQWVEYDEEEDQWLVHGLGSVPQGEVTITKAKQVQRLNAMMDDPKYKDYSNEVTINGTTAEATWYDGNRGGGIQEDFPEDVVKFIYDEMGE